ncbi:MAG: hypothetical protein U0835_16410 [Isosphaeraceae bacterium]
MLRGPFAMMAVLIVGVVTCPIGLPLAVLLGFPMLLGIAVWYVSMALKGRRVDRPLQIVAVWSAYLGLILTLQGIMLAMDTALAGAPPSEEEKRFGRMVAYSGGTLAGAAVVAAYALEWRYRSAGKPKAAAIDELAG